VVVWVGVDVWINMAPIFDNVVGDDNGIVTPTPLLLGDDNGNGAGAGAACPPPARGDRLLLCCNPPTVIVAVEDEVARLSVGLDVVTIDGAAHPIRDVVGVGDVRLIPADAARGVGHATIESLPPLLCNDDAVVR
jgi:hypothetical protein